MGTGPDAPERELARSLRERLENEGTPITVPLRDLRDALPGHRHLSANRRLALQQAFKEVGLVASAPLVETGLDDPFEISLAKPPWHGRARGLWRSLSVVARIVVGLISVAGTLLALSQVFKDNNPKPMSGDINLVAAALVGSDPGLDGEALADSLARSLPALAAANGAQIVVYGRLVRRRGRVLALSRVYVDPSWLIGVEDLGGGYALPSIDMGRRETGTELIGRIRFRAAVARQLRGLAALKIGLGWLEVGRRACAERWFRRAGAVSAFLFTDP